jgi:hypothetical protein
MLTADGQNIRKMEANGQVNKENDVALTPSPPLSFPSKSFQVCPTAGLRFLLLT